MDMHFIYAEEKQPKKKKLREAAEEEEEEEVEEVEEKEPEKEVSQDGAPEPDPPTPSKAEANKSWCLDPSAMSELSASPKSVEWLILLESTITRLIATLNKNV